MNQKTESARTGIRPVRVIALLVAVLLLAGLATGCKKGAGTAAATEPATETDAPKPTGGATEVLNYTAKDLTADDPRLDQVVAVSGDLEVNNRQFPIYYWMQLMSIMNQYGSYISLDMSKPLSEQMMDENRTWEQYLVESAANQFRLYGALWNEAVKEGFTLSEAGQKEIEDRLAALEDDAKQMGYDSGEDYVRASFGAGVTKADFAEYLKVLYLVMDYEEEKYNAITWTTEDLEAYFEAHADEFTDLKREDKAVRVRHILVAFPDEDKDGVSTTEEQAEAKTKADAIYAEYLADPTEDSFIALAEEHSEDPGSKTNGGLYEYVRPGDMVTEFNDWCFDESRKEGDTGIVQTRFGYHIMYFAGTQDYWEYAVSSSYAMDRMNTWIDELIENSSFEVDYTKVVLGEVKTVSAE